MLHGTKAFIKGKLARLVNEVHGRPLILSHLVVYAISSPLPPIFLMPPRSNGLSKP